MTQIEYIKKRVIERKDYLYYKDFPTDAEKRECDLLMWIIDVLNEAQKYKESDE